MISEFLSFCFVAALPSDQPMLRRCTVLTVQALAANKAVVLRAKLADKKEQVRWRLLSEEQAEDGTAFLTSEKYLVCVDERTIV